MKFHDTIQVRLTIEQWSWPGAEGRHSHARWDVEGRLPLGESQVPVYCVTRVCELVKPIIGECSSKMIKALWMVTWWAWGIHPFGVGELSTAKLENRTQSPRRTDWQILGRQVAWVLSKFPIVHSFPTDLAWPHFKRASLLPIGLWTLAHPQTLAFTQALKSRTGSIQEVLNTERNISCWSALISCLLAPIHLPNFPSKFLPSPLILPYKRKAFLIVAFCLFVCFEMLADAEIKVFLATEIVFWNKPLLYLKSGFIFPSTVSVRVCLIFPHPHDSLVLFAFFVIIRIYPEGVKNPGVKLFLLDLTYFCTVFNSAWESHQNHFFFFFLENFSFTVVAIQSLSPVQFIATQWAATCQAQLSFTISRGLLKLMSIKSEMLSNHLILCHSLLILTSIFPNLRFFPLSQLFTSGSQSIGASASASILSVTIQSWFPLVLTGLISLLSKGLSRVFSSPTIFESINSLALSLLHGPTLTSVHDYWKNYSFDYMHLCQQSDVSAFQHVV